jgi:hypothetical protein
MKYKQRLTNAQAKELVNSLDDVLLWQKVDYWQKVLSLHKLNEELKRQGLPKISEEIHNWRMTQALPPLVKKKSTQNANPQKPSSGQRAGKSFAESAGASNASNTVHGDMDESDTVQYLAEQAMDMVEAQAGEASNGLHKEIEAGDSGTDITSNNILT